MNGLGSNTCIQDAYNLAWKIAYVMKGPFQSRRKKKKKDNLPS